MVSEQFWNLGIIYDKKGFLPLFCKFWPKTQIDLLKMKFGTLKYSKFDGDVNFSCFAIC